MGHNLESSTPVDQARDDGYRLVSQGGISFVVDGTMLGVYMAAEHGYTIPAVSSHIQALGERGVAVTAATIALIGVACVRAGIKSFRRAEELELHPEA